MNAAVEAVRGQIRTGVYRAGSVLSAELLLASELGVSRGTVRRAIDILVEAGDLTRRPHARPIIAAGPEANSTPVGHDVFVWISRPIADDPALRFLKGLSKGLSGTQFRMVVREPSRFVGAVVQADERQFFLDLLHNDDVAGAIIERDLYAHNEDVMQRLVERGKRLVFVDAPPPDGLVADHVGTANAAAARACVEHMLNLGHSRIACVVDSDWPATTKDRIKGYWRALKQSGVESLGKLIVATQYPPADESEKALRGEYSRALKKDRYFSDLACRAAREIAAMDPRPTALFIAYDVFALWVCSFLEGIGLRIPEDISVTGFDWLAGWDRNIPDTLTTAAQDFELFGKHAANLLLDRIAGDLPPTPRYVLLDAPLIIRSSTVSDLLLPESEPENLTRAMQPMN